MSKFCPSCGTPIPDGVNFCGKCGAPAPGTPAGPPGSFGQPNYPYYANRPVEVRIPGADRKITAGVLGILLGGLGIHKFYLGYTAAGVIQLVAGLLTCGLFVVVGHIEGIIYLCKSDQEFVDTYIKGRREWF